VSFYDKSSANGRSKTRDRLGIALPCAQIFNCFRRQSLSMDEDIYIEALQRPPPLRLSANCPKRYADDAMRTWLHHRWGRGLEIEAVPLQRCQTASFKSQSADNCLHIYPFSVLPLPTKSRPASRYLTLRTRERFPLSDQAPDKQTSSFDITALVSQRTGLY
jgi:hypothetical protein